MLPLQEILSQNNVFITLTGVKLFCFPWAPTKVLEPTKVANRSFVKADNKWAFFSSVNLFIVHIKPTACACHATPSWTNPKVTKTKKRRLVLSSFNCLLLRPLMRSLLHLLPPCPLILTLLVALHGEGWVHHWVMVGWSILCERWK